MTVDKWFTYWIENIVCDLAPNTKRNYCERYKWNIQPVIGAMCIGDVKPMHCKAVLNRMEVTYAVLFERPTELKGDNGLADWIRMFIRTPFSIIGDKEEENTIILEAADILRKNLFKNGKWYSDYVRLRMKAIKSN